MNKTIVWTLTEKDENTLIAKSNSLLADSQDRLCMVGKWAFADAFKSLTEKYNERNIAVLFEFEA